MIRHLFTLIWNRKKSNFLMITEIFFSFLVLFGVLSLAFYYVNNYNKPLGFQYDKVWVMTLRWNQEKPLEIKEIQSRVKQQIKSNPEVEAVAFSSVNTPFTMQNMNGGFFYNNQSVLSSFYQVDEDFPEVMQMRLTEGRWFNDQDQSSSYSNVVINEALRQALFKDEPVIGKVVAGLSGDNKNPKTRIVGVMEAYKQQGDYAEDSPGYLEYKNLKNPADSANVFFNSLLIRVKPGVTSAFEEKLTKQASQIAKGWTLEIKSMNEMRTSHNKVALIPLIVFSVVCGFLIINVALGLFGVLWYNINRRISEIGLRRAIGAASGQVYRQFIGEVLVLATFGVLFGIVVAAQFPLLQVFQVQTSVYLTALGVAVVIIYVLAAGCAAYPSRQAAKIAPATALHEE
ncbi:ABC transporter permease [Adhaeribacter pallidiroseus]|uniref:Macrolide export ATP-binding/permease protein MacB n=1 Tax=Adhaeribacter pallidiroseus TaxID=2072847 RepID=A0A369QUM8_9BACT|nr:ABC transporter permease [Adhaeribacter pallidiroseus]RDC66499.1 Macrolide export ATP-binding/permease protein MacB [Adhaeribacter pallidiroseus]